MNITIGCSPVTGIIYAYKLDKNGNVRDKIDITKVCVDAVCMHMDTMNVSYESMAGELVFTPKAPESNE